MTDQSAEKPDPEKQLLPRENKNSITLEDCNKNTLFFDDKENDRAIYVFNYHDFNINRFSLKKLRDANRWNVIKHPIVLNYVNEILLESAWMYTVHIVTYFFFLFMLYSYIHTKPNMVNNSIVTILVIFFILGVVSKAKLKTLRDNCQRISPLFTISYVLTFLCYIVVLFFVWTPYLFNFDDYDIETKYYPYDLNMPPVVPTLSLNLKRPPSPLTTFGKFQTKNMAAILEKMGFRLSEIIAAPELNCVETACTFGKAFGCKVFIADALRRARAEGQFMTLEQFKSCGFDVSVKSLGDSFHPNRITETNKDAIKRTRNALQQILCQKDYNSRRKVVLVVGHALTVKIAQSMAVIEDTRVYDPLATMPFAIPDQLNNASLTIADELLDSLDEFYPAGSIDAFRRRFGNEYISRVVEPLPWMTIQAGQLPANNQLVVLDTSTANARSATRMVSSQFKSQPPAEIPEGNTTVII